MRISDWSSDVCSSDLVGRVVVPYFAYEILARFEVACLLTGDVRAGEADGDTRRHVVIQPEIESARGTDAVQPHRDRNRPQREAIGDVAVEILGSIGVDRPRRDRKRTRLNSSH